MSSPALLRRASRTLVKAAAITVLATTLSVIATPAHAAPEEFTVSVAYSTDVVTVGDSLSVTLSVTATQPHGVYQNTDLVATLPSFLRVDSPMDYQSNYECGFGLGAWGQTIAFSPGMSGPGTCTLTIALTAVGSGSASSVQVTTATIGSVAQTATSIRSRVTTIAAPTVVKTLASSAVVSTPAVGADQGYPDVASYQFHVATAAGAAVYSLFSESGRNATLPSLANATAYTVSVSAHNASGIELVRGPASAFTTADPTTFEWARDLLNGDIDSGYLSAGKLTAHSWGQITTTQAAASALSAAGGTQTEYDAAVTAISAAHTGAVWNSSLRDAVRAASAIDTSAYTAGTRAALAATIATATTQLGSTDYQSPAQVATMVTLIDAATANLIAVPSSLSALLVEAAGFAATDHSIHSHSAMSVVLAEILHQIETNAAPSATYFATAEEQLQAVVDSLVDVTPLRAQLAALQATDTTYGTASSVAAVTGSIATISTLLGQTTEMSGADVSLAVSGGAAAISGLVSIEPLLAAHTAASAIVDDGNSARSWNELQIAIRAGMFAAVLWATDPSFTPTAADIDSAVARLVSAEAELVSLRPLSAAITDAKLLVESDFSPTSWQRLQSTIADMEAKLALWSTDATARVTATDVAADTTTLATSRDNLVLTADAGIDIVIDGAPLKSGDTIAAGDRLTVSAKALEPGTEFWVELHSTPVELGRMTVGADGTASLDVVIPVSMSGEHTLHVYSTERGASVATDTATAISITAAPVIVQVAALPVTGGPAGSLTPAIALLMLGATLVAFTARRRGLVAAH